MIAEELINPMIPPLKLSDDSEKARVWMEELRLHQLPVVEGGQFLGMLEEDSLLEGEPEKQPIREYPLDAQEARVNQNQHFYEIIRAACSHDVGLVAVEDEEGKYQGVVTLEDTIQAFAKTTSVDSPGGILVLRMRQTDYSLAEISRLIEAEDAKILSLNLSSDPYDSAKIILTLKVNKMDLTRIIATLERFEYTISAQFHEPDREDFQRERLEALMKYLDL